jgi:hypothetical protein
MLKFFVADPDPGSDAFFGILGSGMEKSISGIRDKHPGSAINIPDQLIDYCI